MSATDKKRRTVSEAEQREGALLVARLGGCTCTPDITFREFGPGVTFAEIAHDGDCGHFSQQKGGDA
jgi:hypothetical protein